MRRGRAYALLICAALLAGCADRPRPLVMVDGLRQPRGMALDDAGNLLVAEAGAPGAVVTPPVTMNQSGRVERIGADGQRAVVAEQLPFTLDTATGTSIGPSDVALVAGELYVLTGEGSAPLSRSVLRVAPGAPPQQVASFLAFALNKNLDGQMMGSAGIQANPYALPSGAAVIALFVSDGASGRILRVTLDGTISVFTEVKGMPPLTGLSFGPDGRLHFAVFSVLPHSPGSGAVWVADGDGGSAPALADLTMPIDVGFDTSGTMFVLEFSDGLTPKDPYAADRGRLLRIDQGGGRAVVVDRLNFPTSMLFTPSGDLLIATSGAFTAAGDGAVLRVPCADLGVPAACAAADARPAFPES